MIGVAHHWFTALTQIWESITWPEFQSELLQRFHGFAISTPSKQSDSIHDSLPDVVDGKNVASVSSTVSPAPFSYSIGYGLLLNDGLSEVGQPQPNSTFNFFLAERDFQPRLLLGHDQFDNGKGERLLLEADNSPNQVLALKATFHCPDYSRYDFASLLRSVQVQGKQNLHLVR
ncbi:hypothetical protein E3N88_09831 [Mikania micrantha]|uniref:Uncharacterized protein n=1 Tax=Mikania micrantha TaxID=192012 RepID=A0A5N6PN94_9ASTR|nr:hypothetical protein E3N88_09831 [Mikania micrantha]